MKNRIKVYRAIHGLTQEELAKKVGVTRQTIIAIEAGKYSPSLELAFKIARALNAKIEDVFIYDAESTASCLNIATYTYSVNTSSVLPYAGRPRLLSIHI